MLTINAVAFLHESIQDRNRDITVIVLCICWLGVPKGCLFLTDKADNIFSFYNLDPGTK